MNRRKKTIYIGILAAGAILLLGDRVFFGSPPQSADAAAGARSLSALGVETPAGPITSVVAAPFPRDLPELPPADALRDVFQMANRARDLLAGLAPNDEAAARARLGGAGRAASTPALFERDHKLNGVMRDGGRWIAIVDNTWLIVGQSIGGCTLAEVNADGAAFTCPGGRAVLSVMPSRDAP